MDTILLPALILAGLGIVFGIGLSYASRVFAIKVDERVTLVREVLPGANCGGCGLPGCDAFASAIVEGNADVNGCPVGGQVTSDEISKIMGLEAKSCERMIARILCNGRNTVSKEKYNYYGIDTCSAAAQLFGGHKACTYGCLGHGDCVRACPFNAIRIINGIARVIEDECKACEKCVAACPKALIEMVPASRKIAVLCRSKDKGPVTSKNCQVGCIGCTKCVKTCKQGAISMEGSLAHIDAVKCTNCGDCMEVCPVMAIRKLDY